MYVLRGVRDRGARRPLPQLRRRAGSSPGSTARGAGATPRLDQPSPANVAACQTPEVAVARSREPNPTLYQAVLDAPDDDAPRLAYADWLDDHGDPDRAQFIRLQCRLARLSTSNANYHRLWTEASQLATRGRRRWLFGRKEDGRWINWHFLRGFPEHVFVHWFQP